MMGGGSESEGIRSDSRSIGSKSAEESRLVGTPGTSSGEMTTFEVAPAARRRLMQSMCPCHAA